MYKVLLIWFAKHSKKKTKTLKKTTLDESDTNNLLRDDWRVSAACNSTANVPKSSRGSSDSNHRVWMESRAHPDSQQTLFISLRSARLCLVSRINKNTKQHFLQLILRQPKPRPIADFISSSVDTASRYQGDILNFHIHH